MDKYLPFYRTVNYYETDMMKVVHHSNYVRWFEEARTYMLDCIGYTYSRIEEEGFMVPVLSVECEYKIPCRFGETVCIIPKLTDYNGVRMKFSYEIWNKDRTELRVTGKSSHCFVNSKFQPILPRKHNPELDSILKETAGKDMFNVISSVQ